ncbi:hypothetical protein [Breoghania sp.]|nr:hypothetical protein [Breoghania sp.]MDJ0932368.1 hypothetical protein [Breoghania sp.]
MTTIPATWAVIGTLGAILLLVTLGLWARYGKMIFVRFVLNGLAGCFG